tara:strand:- start:19 stop:420 length:402 start_codon:yes stop_codon:yes gene_type:complete
MTDKLESVFSSLYDAVVSAQLAVEYQQLQTLTEMYFDEQGNAKTIALNLPNDAGNMSVQHIPLLSLTRNDSLSIDEVQIKMNVELGHGELGLLSRLNRRHDKRSSSAELTIKFKGTAAPEGLARIDDKLIKTF